MKIIRTVVILALFLCPAAFSSCGGTPKVNLNAAANTASENTNSAKTNIEELRMSVNVPYEAEDIVWKETAGRKQINAVLLFSSQDANKIVAEAAPRQAPQNVKLSSESWFPAELIAQSEMSGDDTLNGIAYAADGFYQEPFTAGRIVRIDGTDYFVLELSAK
jgi:hypothetical protein